MTTTVSNLATVQGIYEAFGRGDIPHVLAQLADDVAWEDFADNFATKAGVPWMQQGTGVAAAVRFFEIIGGWTFERFEVKALMEGGNKVAAEVEADVFLGNGNRFREQEVHLWTFNEAGKVASFRHYGDTARHIAAAQG